MNPEDRKPRKTRTYREALKLEFEILALLETKPHSKARGTAVKALAVVYSVDPSTVRDWLRIYKSEGVDGLTPSSRRDLGNFRVPKSTVDAVLRLHEEAPDLSSRSLKRLLIEQGQAHAGARAGKPISAATIDRIRRAKRSRSH